MYSAVRNALLSVLTGSSESDVARVLDPGGMRVSARATSGVGPASQSVGNLSLPDGPNDVSVECPVFPYSLAGTDFSVWPALHVVLTGRAFRQANYIYRDDIYEDVPGTRRTATWGDGVTKTGSTLRTKRPIPRPIDYTFEIRAWARNDVELDLVVDRVMQLLDFKGALEVTLRDGSQVSYDTFLEEGPMLEVPTALLQDPTFREYSQVLTYRVEAYRDTTLQKTTVQTVTQRVIELETYQTNEDDRGTVDPIATMLPDVDVLDE